VDRGTARVSGSPILPIPRLFEKHKINECRDEAKSQLQSNFTVPKKNSYLAEMLHENKDFGAATTRTASWACLLMLPTLYN